MAQYGLRYTDLILAMFHLILLLFLRLNYKYQKVLISLFQYLH